MAPRCRTATAARSARTERCIASMVPALDATYNTGMDRERLESWLHPRHGAPARTWRWRLDEDYDRYEAVESSDAGFRYFAWSHAPGEDGVYREARQTFEEFERHGPLWPMPEDTQHQIQSWLADRKRSERYGEGTQT